MMMKTITLLLATGMVAVPAFAQQAPALSSPPGAAQGLGPNPAQGVKLTDYQATARQRILKDDTDGDGRVSAAEWTAASQARGGGEFADRMFARMDTNKDGFVDAAEIDGASAQRFSRQDTNGDGVLTADEQQAARQRMAEMRRDGGGNQ